MFQHQIHHIGEQQMNHRIANHNQMHIHKLRSQHIK